MRIRNVSVILTFVVAMVVPGRFARLMIHQSYGSVAWAQDATESGQAEDVTSEPDVTPPAIAGTWTGPITDNSFGDHTLTLDVFQKKAKIRGDFLFDSVKQGTFKGKIASNQTTVTIKFKRHHCSVTAVLTLENSDTEMVGPYTSSGHCNNVSTGNIDVTKQ